ncbi:hypothetical protein EYF80_031170 [Liparis tanakae]|uniref:Uncharacterized protein n=1 Tax=Liparis tanakae TaxID=230148 RepID=A0A4Z2GZ69_9TELE|nr:hypothetical protein EYF80_031170 [Liparis tanakae]
MKDFSAVAASSVRLLPRVRQRQSHVMLREADGLAVAPHVRVAADRVAHLREGHVGHGDGAAAQHLEARLVVEGHQDVLAHEERAAHAGQAAQVLQVAPQQDGPFALLPKGAVHRQDVDVDRGAARLREPMMKATRRPSSSQPMDSSGHKTLMASCVLSGRTSLAGSVCLLWSPGDTEAGRCIGLMKGCEPTTDMTRPVRSLLLSS